MADFLCILFIFPELFSSTYIPHFTDGVCDLNLDYTSLDFLSKAWSWQ